MIFMIVTIFTGCVGTLSSKRALPKNLMNKEKKGSLLLKLIEGMDTTELIKDLKMTVEKDIEEIEAIRSKKDKSDKQINNYINIYETYYKKY